MSETPSPGTAPAQSSRLEIETLIRNATTLADRIRVELPGHKGIMGAADAIAAAARDAGQVSRRMHRLLSLHRLPVIFLAVALLSLGLWTWMSFFRVSTLTLALPNRDAAALKDVLGADPRLQVRVIDVPGSREAARLVTTGAVDVAFVQGGVPIPPTLRHAILPSPEVVLFMARPGVTNLGGARVLLTSREGEGSHAVLEEVLRVLAVPASPRLLHQWESLTTEGATGSPAIPPGLDAVFVVKDPSDDATRRGIRRLAEAGFELRDLPLGARATRIPWLDRTVLEPGWLCDQPLVPSTEIPGWSVRTLLVARNGLTPRLLGQANRLLAPRGGTLEEGAVAVSAGAAGEVIQSVDAFLGVLVNIGLAFLALLGLDAWAWRKQFHELNALVSLLSQLQSNKDVLAVKDAELRAENMRYLSMVSDLLGMISHLSSWYTQENSALAFNSLSDVIHERCNSLKINIQLKLLQSAIRE